MSLENRPTNDVGCMTTLETVDACYATSTSQGLLLVIGLQETSHNQYAARQVDRKFT